MSPSQNGGSRGGDRFPERGVSATDELEPITNRGQARALMSYGRADDRSGTTVAAVEDASAGCSSRGLAPGQAGR